MIHNIRNIMLAISDPRGRIPRKLEVHIHILNVASRVDWDLVLRELCFIIELRSVVRCCEDVCCLLKVSELVIVIKNFAEYHFACEKDGVLAVC